MYSKTEVFFSINLPENEVAPTTLAMEREPSRLVLLRATDPKDPTKTVESHSWQLVGTLAESERVEKHVGALLEILLPKATVIRPLAARFYSSIHCVVSYYEDYATPGIQLSQETVHSLAELGLAVTFDLYFYGAPGRAN